MVQQVGFKFEQSVRMHLPIIGATPLCPLAPTMNVTDLPPMPATPLGRYRHVKGGEYEVIGVARHSETLEPLVVYRALGNASGW
jgi:hypothetical protein